MFRASSEQVQGIYYLLHVFPVLLKGLPCVTLRTGDLSGLKNLKQMSPVLLPQPVHFERGYNDVVPWFGRKKNFANQVDSTLCPIMPVMLISGFLGLAQQ